MFLLLSVVELEERLSVVSICIVVHYADQSALSTEQIDFIPLSSAIFFAK